MNQQITGNCAKCGAPYYQESPWFGINPPPINPMCACWNIPKVTISDNTGKFKL